MNLEAKVLNPIIIRLGKNSNTVIFKNGETLPLVPGVMFKDEHYGFVLITDCNGKQRENMYPTQCKIHAVGMENQSLKIFEDGKKFPWIFGQSGNLEHSTFNEFTDELKEKYAIIVENYNMFMNEPTLINPIHIKIAKNPEESVILKDEVVQENYPLHPGAVFGGIHYGFVLLIDTDEGPKEIVYPTQNRLYAAGIEKDAFNDLKIFENGKYHPWVFSPDGELKKSSSYNELSKADKEYVQECYDLNQNSADPFFTIQRKK